MRYMRAMVDALVEQDGVDLGGCLVGKTWRAQKVEYGSTFHDSQRASWPRPGPKRGQRPGQTGTPTVDAGARHVQGRAGAGGQTGSRRQRDDRCRHDLSSLSGVASGIPSRAATFLRNSHRLGGLGGSSLEDIPECFCPPLEVGKNSLAVALLVIGGARIGIFHAVTQRVVKDDRPLPPQAAIAMQRGYCSVALQRTGS